MRKSEQDRLKRLLEEATGTYDKSGLYDAIAAAERDEVESGTQLLLHEAAMAVLHGHIDQARTLLDAISPQP